MTTPSPLTGDAAALRDHMRSISEKMEFAGWLHGTEWVLWRCLLDWRSTGRAVRNPYAEHPREVTHLMPRLDELQRLAAGWVWWLDGYVFVPEDRWVRLVEARDRHERPYVVDNAALSKSTRPDDGGGRRMNSPESTYQEQWDQAPKLTREEMFERATTPRPLDVAYTKTLFAELYQLEGRDPVLDRVSIALRAALSEASEWQAMEEFPEQRYCGAMILRKVGAQLFAPERRTGDLAAGDAD